MSYTKIWIHSIWSTKNRIPSLKNGIRDIVFTHIKENALEKDIYIDCINGYEEHVHCLICLKREQSIADCLQLIKGESSYWINKNKLIDQKFEWQDDYFAVSVSESQIQVLRNYVKNQYEHHKKKSFTEEYDEFIKNYGFNLIRNG